MGPVELLLLILLLLLLLYCCYTELALAAYCAFVLLSILFVLNISPPSLYYRSINSLQDILFSITETCKLMSISEAPFE